MALRWLESFDSLATADLSTKYDAVTGSTAPSISGTARTGTGSLSCSDANTNATVVKVLDAQPTYIVGFAFRYTMSGGNKQIFEWRDGASVQSTLWYETSTRKLFVVGASATLGISDASEFLSDGVWYYIEWLSNFSNTGSGEVRVDGVPWFTYTGDTSLSGAAQADRFVFRAGGSTGTSTARLFDDVYVLDGTTGAGTDPCNDFLGDCKVECIRPNGNGNSSQLVGSDGNSTDNYLLVDDTTQDGDTTYVQSSTVGEKDTYAYSDLSTATGTVYGVQINPYARKTDAGSRSIVSVARLGATEVDGDVSVLGSSYDWSYDVLDVAPGGADWTVTDVNSAEFGVKVNA